MKNIITISGKSGSGKTTLAEELVSTCKYKETVSFTTREKRPGEIDGKHYNFITKEDFDKKMRQGSILEYTNINGNFYGTDVNEIDKIFKEKKTPVIVCDPKCPLSIKEKDNSKINVIPVFIDADSRTLSKRIIDRIKDEYENIKVLREDSLNEALKYEEQMKKSYTKRIEGMSDLSLDEIEDIFKNINETGEYKKGVLEEGINSPYSKEAKWENMIDYDLRISAKDIEEDLNKGVKMINKINKKISRSNDYSYSV